LAGRSAWREFIDGHGLPATFEDWQGKAETMLERMRANGHAVERVMINPATFPAWCRENGFELTSRARQHYAGVMVRPGGGKGALSSHVRSSQAKSTKCDRVAVSDTERASEREDDRGRRAR